MSTEELVRSKFLHSLDEIIPDVELIRSVREHQVDSGRIDLLLEIRFGKTVKNLVCEVKSSGEPRYVFQAVSQAKFLALSVDNSYPVVISPRIGEKSREICKSFNVGYIDLTGNIFLRFNGVHVEKEHAERGGREERRRVRNLFAPLSSRVIRILLTNSGKSWTLSELSEVAKISIGYVHKIAKTLEDQGYAVRDHDYRLKLSRARSLLEEWASEYDFVSQNVLHNYYTFEHDSNTFIKEIAVAGEGNRLRYALTLHAGASMVAPYVRYTNIHFYIDANDVSLWRSALDLRPVESGGTVMLVEPYDEYVFWGLQDIGGVKVVSDIQLYVDLFNYPARGREQADFLRNKRMEFV